MTDDLPEKPPHPTRASEAFFGRRKGLRLNKGQAALFETLLPKLRLEPASPSPENLTGIFDKPKDRVVLEIGFGGGEHLVKQATLFPDTGFIGVEPFVNGMAKALVAIEDAGLENIRLYDDDATRILDWLPENSIDQIDLMYPDPWPKKKHWKRRFVNRKNLDRFARVMMPGGLFRFASDIDTYVNWTLNHCYRHGRFQWQAKDARDWHTPYETWIRTRYEAKAIREGRTPAYLSFRHAARPAAQHAA